MALGFALMGEAGALYFTLVNRRPGVAGFFFAIAFGNRTEVLLAAPIFFYLLCRTDAATTKNNLAKTRPDSSRSSSATAAQHLVNHRMELVKFALFPTALGLATLAYNHARFGSISDFGYMRIPQVASESLLQTRVVLAVFNSAQRQGHAVGRMETDPGEAVSDSRGFGGSIFISSPFLLLLFRFRRGLRDFPLLVASWLAIVILTFLLWLHANPGGWQFSYRYGMILLPWMFLIILNNGRAKATKLEVTLFGLSVAINAYATYLFLWTDYVKP